jgi:hypothetical protein
MKLHSGSLHVMLTSEGKYTYCGSTVPYACICAHAFVFRLHLVVLVTSRGILALKS